MAWQETRVMDSRMLFISEVLKGDYAMSELCEGFGISRKTGYKWLARYMEQGAAGLSDHSRAPHNHPHGISAEIKEAILAAKGRFSHWGPRKIAYRLRREHPGWERYPAVSTIGAYLKSQGLVCSRRRLRRSSPMEGPLTNGHGPNDVWCTDFKGHFRTGDGARCNPLTITDHFTRYLLCCRHLDKMSYNAVRMQFERAFREYGLPLVIRSDNGTPFSSNGIGGLSRLSAWWIRLGIYPERTEPARPDQNGRHERMHLTLKIHTAMPAAGTLRRQQELFEEFGREYNDERPHEAIGMQTPVSVYVRSPRVFPSHLATVEYAEGMVVLRVENHGDIYYKCGRVFLSEALAGENIGLEQISEDASRLWYCNYELGILDHKRHRIEPVKHYPLSAGASPCTIHNSQKVLPMSSV